MKLSYRQIKWLLLIIPSITIGLWEYVRHEILLPYISMEMGNWLAPFIVLAVTMTFLLKLFAMMEQLQNELNRERVAKAALEERERIARELHDGIAQSLFLLSVKVDQLEKSGGNVGGKPDVQVVRKTVHQVNEYIRQAISNLRYPPRSDALPWKIRFRTWWTLSERKPAYQFPCTGLYVMRGKLPKRRLNCTRAFERRFRTFASMRRLSKYGSPAERKNQDGFVPLKMTGLDLVTGIPSGMKIGTDSVS